MGFHMRRTFAVVVFLLAGITAASTALCADPDLDAMIRHTMTRFGFPGMQTVVIKDGRVVWSKSYGYAVLDQPGPRRAMRDDSLLFSASVTKMFVTVAVMQQVEQGNVALDDDIDRHLAFAVRNPEWPDVPITLRMLLSHLSSLNSEDDARANETAVYGLNPSVSLEEIIKADFAPGGARRWTEQFTHKKPGTERIYSNDGYALAAYVLQDVVHQSFDSYVDQFILKPLRMTDTSYWLKDLPIDRFAVGYASLRQKDGRYSYTPARAYWEHSKDGDSIIDNQVTCPDYPAGCAHISSRDFSKFMLMLMNGGTLDSVRILSQASVAAMITPSGLRSVDGRMQGLGLDGPQDLRGRQVWGKDGEDRGAANAFYFNPKTHVGAIVFANGMDPDFTLSYTVDDLALHLMSWFE
jgi:CubicO group peptidase (beta-lactamase class C family)